MQWKLLLLVGLTATARAFDPIPYPECTDEQYFDISSLSCTSCPTGQQPDPSGRSCQCTGGKLASSGGVWSCDSCGDGEAPTRDGLACLPCDSLTTDGYNSVTDECTCPENLGLVERDGLGGLLPAKMCMGCPSATRPISTTAGVWHCEPCPAEDMEAKQVAGRSDYECRCKSGFQERKHAQGWWGRDTSCLEQTAYDAVKSYDTASADTITYRDLVGESGTKSVESKLFAQLLIASATGCRRAVSAAEGPQPLLRGNEACQALANLCVLQMYDEGAPSCELYREMQEASETEVNEEAEWKKRLPALYYTQGPTVYTLNDVPLSVSLKGEGSRLTYVMAAYALNGTYLGLRELGDELQLCTGKAEDPTAFLQFGVGLEVECSLKLGTLLAVTEPTFYDLYLRVDNEQLYPVPVRLANLRVNGRRVNENSASITSQQNDQLVRRFFTVDAASGLAKDDSVPSVVQYLTSATLTTTIIVYTPTNIYPPLLDLAYGAVALDGGADDAEDAAAALGDKQLPSRFVSKYTMELDETLRVVTIVFVIAMVLWGLGWLMQMYLWMRRNQQQQIDGAFLLKAFSQLCRVFSDVFFWYLFGFCGWMYVLFKNQDEVFVMMPPDSALRPFRALLGCAFGAKCLHVADFVWSQAHHDVFFVDWEQPRGVGDDKQPTQVSVWRSVFAANEWVKLQASRAVHVEFNLLFLLLLLRGLDQELYATEIPNEIGTPGITPNPLLRFALSSFMLLIMSLCQWLFRWAIWDRFVEDRVWQFVDLLAVTNISCFLMEEKYYGHYLHGRSVHSHSDSDMLDFNRNLKREQDQLCAKRGLQENSDVQTFQIFLSRGVRERYESIFEGSRSRLPGPKRGVDEKGRPRGFRSGPEEALVRQKEVSTFLSSFVSNNLEAHKLEIRQKEYYERLLGLPPELGYSRKSVFLEDPAGRFKELLLAGREYDLVVLSVLTYGLFDMLYVDTFIAIFATYLVDLAVRFARRELAKRNIAAKTLIDDRLLL